MHNFLYFFFFLSFIGNYFSCSYFPYPFLFDNIKQEYEKMWGMCLSRWGKTNKDLPLNNFDKMLDKQDNFALRNPQAQIPGLTPTITIGIHWLVRKNRILWKYSLFIYTQSLRWIHVVIYILEGAHTRIIWRGTTLWALSTLFFMKKKLSYIAFAKFIIVKKLSITVL